MCTHRDVKNLNLSDYYNIAFKDLVIKEQWIRMLATESTIDLLTC